MNNPNSLPCPNRWCRYGVIVCLAVQFVLACDTARRLTPTHDEYWHLPLGLLIWKTGRFDCDVINPPELRLWAALPLILGGAKLETDATHPNFGEIGDHFWMSNPEHRMLWFALGRIMVAIVNGGTGWLLACWGRRWFGDIASLAVAMLWCCCPNILAHGSLVTHDAAATFGFVSTLYAVVLWCEQPTGRRAAVAGFCLGFAQLLKVTCVLLVPLSLITWILIKPRSLGADDPKPTWKMWSVHWVIVLGLAIAVLNAGYLGQQSFQSLRSMPLSSKRFQQLQRVEWLNFLPIPIPRFHVQALDRVALDLQNAHPVYLDFAWSITGYRMYYVMTLAYKLPIGTLLMLALSMSMLVWSCFQFWSRRKSETGKDPEQPSISWRRQCVLAAPILMLIVPASFGTNQLGIRYVLPILPFVYLFAAESAISLSDLRWRWKQWLVIAALISLPCSLRYHPHHLTYFNEWAGGPDEGRFHLADSNLDWGQDLHGLAEYLRQHKIDKIGLAYFGTVHPQSIGIQYELPPRGYPRPGDYAISVNFLMGRSFLIRTPTSTGTAPIPKFDSPNDPSGVTSTQDDEFGYLRFFEPRARIGHSIYVYHLTQEDIARYRLALMRSRNF